MSLYESLKISYPQLKAKVSRTVKDGEKLECCGGVVLLHTPGHTFGHISIYLEQTGILIPGDIIYLKGNQLVPAPKATIIDQAACAQSIRKLAQYDIKTLLCYHGGLYKVGDIKVRLLELAIAYERA